MGSQIRTAEAPVRGDATSATVADAIAAAIQDAGVELTFTFPGGGSNLALLEALQSRGVATVLTRSEVGGALMASAVADLTGKPGVLVVGLGPGAASAMNGVAYALLDRSPLLLVVDRYSEADAATTGHQLLDHAAIFAPVTKACVDAAPSDLQATLEQAIALALEPPAGPVLLEMRRDRAPLRVALRPPRDATRGEAPATSPAAGDVAAAALALGDARRPILLIGEEARRDVDPRHLVELAERLECPVLSTYKAKGTFPETHRLAAGMLTGAEIERPLLARADVLLGVGLDPVELLVGAWPYEAELIALRRTDAVDSYLRPRWTLAGEIGAAVTELLEALGEPASEWQPGEAALWAGAMIEPLRVAGGSLSTWRAVEVAQEVAGDALVTVDAGAHMFAVTWFWRSTRPNRFLISNGLATMGYAVPAAIGAALVRPEETVLAFTGDGGFTINAAELETAARLGARVIVLVLNDASLSLIRVKQEEIGLARSNVDFLRSDFARVAEGMNVQGARASTESELRAALEVGLANPGTTLIDITIDGREHAELHRRIRKPS